MNTGLHHFLFYIIDGLVRIGEDEGTSAVGNQPNTYLEINNDFQK